MGKKIDRSEPKKECPSCGLGVSLEANICEFCGWDFEEEDEWILQIEKLERELLLEKQKFEPGTVNHKIESTLRSPVMERAEAARTAAKENEPEAVADTDHAEVFTAEQFLDRETAPAHRPHAHRPQAPEPVPEARTAPPEPAKTRKVRSVKQPAAKPAPEPEPTPQPTPPVVQSQAPPVRRVRQVASKPKEEPEQLEPKPSPKVRTVRKVKG